LRVCGFGTTSLMMGRICRLQLLLALDSALILGSESRGTHDRILLSKIRDSPNLEGQAPVFIFPRNRVAHLYPLFIASYYSQGNGGGIRTRLHAKSKSKLCYDPQSVDQSVSVSWTHLGVLNRFFFLPNSCGFVDMGRPLWREDGYIFYNVQCTIYLRFTCYLLSPPPRGELDSVI
jgi:hypothetical protein